MKVSAATLMLTASMVFGLHALTNAKIRSYANGSILLERMKQLRANGTCI
jgi:hypothetical protein